MCGWCYCRCDPLFHQEGNNSTRNSLLKRYNYLHQHVCWSWGEWCWSTDKRISSDDWFLVAFIHSFMPRWCPVNYCGQNQNHIILPPFPITPLIQDGEQARSDFRIEGTQVVHEHPPRLLCVAHWAQRYALFFLYCKQPTCRACAVEYGWKNVAAVWFI